MDTFFEQIIYIKKKGSAIAGIVGIWVLAFILTYLLFIYPILGGISFLLICGILYGAFKLSCRFNVEYEYIITNGTFDVDKIVNRSSRKRMLSFELSTVSRLEKYNPNLIANIDKNKLVFACNETDEAYLLVAEKEGKGSSYLVFAPDERLKGAIVKFVPKFISNSAFK